MEDSVKRMALSAELIISHGAEPAHALCRLAVETRAAFR
jgi:hypothetical protein